MSRLRALRSLSSSLSLSTSSLSRCSVCLYSRRSFSNVPRQSPPASRHSVSRSDGAAAATNTRHRVAAANARAAEVKLRALPTVDEREFRRRSSDLLTSIRDGLVDMSSANKEFAVELIADQSLIIRLAPRIGTYEIVVDLSQRRVSLFSPSSGVHFYSWSSQYEQWACDHDGHFLLELLVRELIQVAQGVPKL